MSNSKLFSFGNDAIKEVNTDKKSYKDTFITLKKGDSVKIKLISRQAIISYKSHSSFEHKIYSTPCVKPLGEECLLCKVAASGREEFKNIYAKPRYMIAVGDMESGDIKFYECSKATAKLFDDTCNEYSEVLDSNFFTLKKIGDKGEHSLQVSMKFKGNEREQFDNFQGIEITEDMFEAVLQPRNPEFILEALYAAGYPVKEELDASFVPKVFNEVPNVEADIVEIKDDCIPF
jgi:hypothetical protein